MQIYKQMEKLTVNDVRKIGVGKSKTFRLANARAVRNAQAQVYIEARLSGLRYKTSANYELATLTIERIS